MKKNIYLIAFKLLFFGILNAQNYIYVSSEPYDEIQVTHDDAIFFCVNQETLAIGEHIEISGGEAPFNFLWSNSEYLTNEETINPTLDLTFIEESKIFTLTITDANNCSTQISFSVSPEVCLSTFELQTDNQQIKVYPTLTDQTISIEIYQKTFLENSVSFTIYDALGNKVYQDKGILSSNKETNIIDVSNIATGSYFIHITGNTFNKIEKFIKK